MIFEETNLKGAYVISLNLFNDNRGGFARVFCKNEFEKIGHKKEFVQINHSYNKHSGTIRGMHFQLNPFSEIKLIRCIKGSVLDVIVDLRQESPTFLQHFSIEINEENKKMIYLPENFAHGFQTLENNSELLYHHTEFYNPNFEAGLKFDDPKLAIEWPLPPVFLSERDLSYKFINNNFKGN